MLPKGEESYKNEGVALLLVVSVISLLTVIILQFNRSMSDGLQESWSFRNREQLRAFAESGVDLAIAVLIADSYTNDFDSLQDTWATLGEAPIALFGSRAEVTVTITDLSGRFFINSMVNQSDVGQGEVNEGAISAEAGRQLFSRLLKSEAFVVEDDLQADEIVDAVIDWLDSDDKESPYGAEGSFYESLDPPYTPRNGLMKLPHEIGAVKGVTDELLYGNDEKNGLVEYITVFGDSGSININSASPTLIQAFDDRIDLEQAELLIQFREEENNAESLSDPNWYLDVSGWPGDITLPPALITTSSDFFRIRSEAILMDERLTITAYLRRSGKEAVEILYRKTQ